VLSSVLTAYLTLRSLKLAAALVLIALTMGLYSRSRTAGLTAVWSLWLLLPAVRRVFDLAQGYASADPLAVTPFITTGLVSVIELGRARLSGRAKRLLVLALAGFAFGAPLGLLASPIAAAYALVAYGTGVLAFGAGYRERQHGTLSLARVLALTATPLALYGILQYVAPLAQWDTVWLANVGPDFNSIGSKAAGTLRVFSTLNSPGTLSIVLGLGIVSVLTTRRFGLLGATTLVVTLGGLALTLVRSTWIALAVALVLLLFVSPARVVRRVLVVVALGAVAFPLVVIGSPAATSVSTRANTVSNLAGDTSAQARLSTPQLLIPQAIRQPLGFGLGSAGEASRLSSGGSGLRATDDALLSLMFQNGPVGFVLVLAAYAMGMVSVLRNIRRRRSANDVLVFGCTLLLTALLLTGDVFYGVTGAVIWYLLGFAVRGDEVRGSLRPAPA